MSELVHFHFLRPEWLLCIPLLMLATAWLCRQRHQQTGFEQWIDKHLLEHISTAEQRPASRLPYLLLILIWSLVTIALAGPTWKQLPQPLHLSLIHI